MSELEQYYSTGQVAAKLAFSEDTIRKLFGEHPDVIKLGSAETRKKRGYVVLRIPESAVFDVIAKLTGSVN